MTHQTLLPGPLGDILLRHDDHAIRGLWFVGQRHEPRDTAVTGDGTHPLARAAARWLRRYFDGDQPAEPLPLRLDGTPFQRAVWDVLRTIPRGGTLSYAEVARRVGVPNAVRAVGAAVGRNPVSIVVPCHRVVGSDGALTGYAGGVPRKLHLLRLEGALDPNGRARPAAALDPQCVPAP